MHLNFIPTFRALLVASALLTLTGQQVSPAVAQVTDDSNSIVSTGSKPSRLPEVVVQGAADQQSMAVEQVRPLPEVEGTKIYSGKKTTVTEVESLPQIPNQNYRQLFSQTPGLLTSEASGEGFASVSYRGLGDPHESYNLNTLRDGIVISADPFGYPAVYYQPPIDSIQQVEFLRGGAGLVYGPQVGGALNYVSRAPSSQPMSFLTKQVFGERNFYSTYNELSGTQGDVSYLGFFHHRGSDGFRKENSDYAVNNGSLTIGYRASDQARWKMNFDAYEGDHGEAGGLTLESGPGLASFPDDGFQTITRHDRLRINRYMATAGVDYDLSAKTKFEGKFWGGYYGRYSRRQAQGSAESFGGLYDGETNNIVLQEFKSVGMDARWKHNYSLGLNDGATDEHTLTAGFTALGTDSPFRQEVGAQPFANTGALTKLLHRETFGGSLFVENRFAMGRLKLTPGFRMENIYQGIQEKMNVGGTVPLRDEDAVASVPLFGLGAAYDLGSEQELYANISQGYKPVAFQDTIPLNTGDTISGDLNPAHATTYETGVRGFPTAWSRYDVSTFFITFNDQFGRVGNNIQNVGDSQTLGLETALEVDTIGLIDAVADSKLGASVGALRLYGNASLLDAEFSSGPVDGKTPQYAPNYLVRAGVIYDYFRQGKVALLGTFVDDHFADDGNTANRLIPSYEVWDLTAEIPILQNSVSLVAGVNNLFDEEYYARVRSNGIDPGLPRNAYGGFSLQF